MAEQGSSLKSYKNKGKTAEKMRQRRAQITVSLRKKRIYDELSKRRNLLKEDDKENASPMEENIQQDNVSMDEIIAGINSNDPAQQLSAMQKCCDVVLHYEEGIHIPTDVIHKILTFVKLNDQPELQFEAVYAIANIISENSVLIPEVMKTQTVESLVAFLATSNAKLAEQAVLALGNIAAEGPDYRDHIIKCGAMEPLLALITPQTPLDFLQLVTWAASKLCSNIETSGEQMKHCLTTFTELILLHEDRDILIHACSALIYLTYNATDEMIEQIVNTNLVPRLIQLFDTKDEFGLTVALKAFGNIVTKNYTPIKAVVDNEYVPLFKQLLCHQMNSVPELALCIINNISVDKEGTMQPIIDDSLVPYVINILRQGNSSSQREAVWTLGNYALNCSKDQMHYIVSEGVIPPLCYLLGLNDTEAIIEVLHIFEHIFIDLQDTKSVCHMIEECGGLENIENLQNHDNYEVSVFSENLYKYFKSDQAD